MIKTTYQLSEQFNMNYRQVIIILSMKGSPAFKKGMGKKSDWLCDDEEFKRFLQKQSEKHKS